jgi:hypothetical protein
MPLMADPQEHVAVCARGCRVHIAVGRAHLAVAGAVCMLPFANIRSLACACVRV